MEIHEQLLAHASNSASQEWTEYYSALINVLLAAKQYRYHAPAKTELPEKYHAAMEAFDRAWDAFDKAAEKVGRSIAL